MEEYKVANQLLQEDIYVRFLSLSLLSLLLFSLPMTTHVLDCGLWGVKPLGRGLDTSAILTVGRTSA